MPVHRTIVTIRGETHPAYQWGNHGKKYPYIAGDEKSREAAKKKAEAQGRAAYAHGYKG
ncbi:MAG: hypothetical protein ACFFG0_08175 [Candidatus Thorarchaeota archaeon]